MSDEWYSPGHKLTARVARPGEPLWQVCVDHVTWSAELRFHGESYGVETQIFRDGELVIGRRFVVREQAIKWADEQRRDIERGWTDLNEQQP
jgi:hypothetical protein